METLLLRSSTLNFSSTTNSLIQLREKPLMLSTLLLRRKSVLFRKPQLRMLRLLSSMQESVLMILMVLGRDCLNTREEDCSINSLISLREIEIISPDWKLLIMENHCHSPEMLMLLLLSSVTDTMLVGVTRFTEKLSLLRVIISVIPERNQLESVDRSSHGISLSSCNPGSGDHVLLLDVFLF